MNEEIAKRYLEWFSRHYTQLKNKYRKFCKEKDFLFDEDVFSDTYLKVYESIKKNGLKDHSEQGFDNYTFRSFKQNIQRERQYCRNSKRDMNVSSDEINTLYEDWYNINKDDSLNKVKSDLLLDYSIIYIMHRVEEHFDQEHFHLFSLKTMIPNMTYKKLAETTKCSNCRQKVVSVKNWIKANISKEEIKKAFIRKYGELIDA